MMKSPLASKIRNLIFTCLTFRNFPTLILREIFRSSSDKGNAPTASLWNGRNYFLDPENPQAGRAILQEIWADRVYDLPDFVPGPITIVDIGANIGGFTIFAAHHVPQASIIAVEPGASVFRLLKKNIEENGFSSQVTTLNAAVSDSIGTASFFESSQSSSRNSLFKNKFLLTDEVEAKEVAVWTLEGLFRHCGVQQCDYMKMDCEGAEFKIIDQTDRETLRRIEQLSMEYHEQVAGCSVQTLKEKLEQCGFRVSVSPFPGHDGLGLLEARKI